MSTLKPRGLIESQFPIQVLSWSSFRGKQFYQCPRVRESVATKCWPSPLITGLGSWPTYLLNLSLQELVSLPGWMIFRSWFLLSNIFLSIIYQSVDIYFGSLKPLSNHLVKQIFFFQLPPCFSNTKGKMIFHCFLFGHLMRCQNSPSKYYRQKLLLFWIFDLSMNASVLLLQSQDGRDEYFEVK